MEINECKQFDDFKKEIATIIEAMTKDAEKFYNNENSAAGLRLRKSYKLIKSLVESTSKETLPKKAGK